MYSAHCSQKCLAALEGQRTYLPLLCVVHKVANIYYVMYNFGALSHDLYYIICNAVVRFC